MKRKSKLQTILKDIDLKKVFNEEEWNKQIQNHKKEVEEDKKRYEKEIKQEQKRVKNMKCPTCKSTKKEHVVNSKNNGIFGPGYRSWITDEYYLCLGCGVRYEDLNKKEIKPPNYF